jgi:LPXTG-motif cell wall-anchored protein
LSAFKSLREKKTNNIPLWAGVAAIVAGGLLLVVSRTGGPK